jgi:acylglycerol lipase
MIDSGEQIAIAIAHGAPQQIRVWRGGGPYAILALHGLDGHARWFGALGPALARRGVSLIAVDRAGSGVDGRPRGESPHIEAWLTELAELCDLVAPPGGLFLLGHSWGAKRLVIALHERMLPVRGALFVAPLIFLADDVDPPERWDASEPRTPEDPFVIRFPDERLTADPAVRRMIAEDPERLRHVTANFVIEDARLSRRIDAMRSPLPVPAWLGLGREDRMIDEERTRRWFERMAPGGGVCVIEGAGHLVLLERAEELAEHIAHFLGAVT